MYHHKLKDKKKYKNTYLPTLKLKDKAETDLFFSRLHSSDLHTCTYLLKMDFIQFNPSVIFHAAVNSWLCFCIL